MALRAIPLRGATTLYIAPADLMTEPTPIHPFAPDVPQSAALQTVTTDASDAERVSRELSRLGEAATEDGLMDPAETLTARKFQKQLVKARLGSAAGLFTALRCKHPATASHSLRVALVCSGWGAGLELTEEEQSTLEVAALLHDVGKIGVPDAILSKPNRLQPEEVATMACSRAMAVEMLSAAGAPQLVLDTVLTANAWFDGSNGELPLVGEQIPLAARMLAIADAFDSMTTDHVYRRARSANDWTSLGSN